MHRLSSPLSPAHTQSPAWLLKPGCFCASRAAYTLRSWAGAPPGRASVSEQRQRSLFGSPLLPLHNIHSGKGRTTSERVTGERTPHLCAPAQLPPLPRPHPKPGLASQAGLLLCFPGGLHPTELGRCTPREGPRLGAATAVALWEPFATFIPSSFRQRADNERASDGGTDATPKCTGLKLPPLVPVRTQSPAWLLKPGCFCASRAAYTLRSWAGAPPGRAPVSEQRQRSLFGSPLLPLHNIHSGKGRTTSERRDGGPDATPKCTGSCSRSP